VELCESIFGLWRLILHPLKLRLPNSYKVKLTGAPYELVPRPFF
jgi:hypothetical protein